jgi:hypothetical protein
MVIYNSRTDYVIDLDTMQFHSKSERKKILEKNFIKDKDYICLLYQSVRIMLTIHAFKLFCMNAGTKKEIHNIM